MVALALATLARRLMVFLGFRFGAPEVLGLATLGRVSMLLGRFLGLDDFLTARRGLDMFL